MTKKLTPRTKQLMGIKEEGLPNENYIDAHANAFRYLADELGDIRDTILRIKRELERETKVLNEEHRKELLDAFKELTKGAINAQGSVSDIKHKYLYITVR